MVGVLSYRRMMSNILRLFLLWQSSLCTFFIIEPQTSKTHLRRPRTFFFSLSPFKDDWTERTPTICIQFTLCDCIVSIVPFSWKPLLLVPSRATFAFKHFDVKSEAKTGSICEWQENIFCICAKCTLNRRKNFFFNFQNATWCLTAWSSISGFPPTFNRQFSSARRLTKCRDLLTLTCSLFNDDVVARWTKILCLAFMFFEVHQVPPPSVAIKHATRS